MSYDAVTPVMSALFEFVIVNKSSYDNDIPVPAVNNAFTLSSTLSFVKYKLDDPHQYTYLYRELKNHPMKLNYCLM